MVGSVGANGQQSVPGAVAFKPGQTSQATPLDTRESNSAGVSKNAATQTTLQSGKTEEISSKVFLSRDNTRPAPSDAFASNNARGSQLDIRV
jgi:hypothetical protein